jgi:enolase
MNKHQIVELDKPTEERVKNRWYKYYSSPNNKKYLKYARQKIAKDCEAAIEHEIDMISGPMDEDDYTGFRNLRTAFENIMKIIRGENE